MNVWDIFEPLKNLIILAMIVTIATDNFEDLCKPYFTITKYKLTVAFVLTGFGISGLNVGIMESLKIITESAQDWIHWFDLTITVFVLVKGAQSIHRLAESIVNFFAKRTTGAKGE